MHWLGGIRICTILILPIRVLWGIQMGFSMTELPSKARLLLFDQSNRETSTMVYSISAGYNTGIKYPYCIAYHVASIVHGIYNNKRKKVYCSNDLERMHLLESNIETIISSRKTKYIIRPDHENVSMLIFRILTQAIADFRFFCNEYRMVQVINRYKTTEMRYLLDKKIKQERFTSLLDDSDLSANPFECKCQLKGNRAHLRDTLVSYWEENYIGAKTVAGWWSKQTSTYENELSTLLSEIPRMQNDRNPGSVVKPDNKLVRLLHTLTRVESKCSLFSLSMPSKQHGCQEYTIPVVRVFVPGQPIMLEINVEFPWDFPYFNMGSKLDFEKLCSLAHLDCLESKLVEDKSIGKMHINLLQVSRGMCLSFRIYEAGRGMFDYKQAISTFAKYIDSISFKNVRKREIAEYNREMLLNRPAFNVYNYCLHAIAWETPDWESQLPDSSCQLFFDHDLYTGVFEQMKDRSYWRVFLVGNVLQQQLPVYLHPVQRLKYQIDNAAHE